ncbi:MAG: hypothetical protein V4677_01615 [Bacteroidota bacterium]
MITDIYSIDNIVKTYFDDEINAVVVVWQKLTTNEHFQKSCEAQLTAMEKHNTGLLIIDTSETIGIPYPEDQEWLVNVLYPRIKKIKHHLLINILPENQISKIGVKTWTNSCKKNTINFTEVFTMGEACNLGKTFFENAG